MRLLFTNARRINPGRDGFDFQFFYNVDDDKKVCSIHVVTTSEGSELAWNISEQDLYEYSQRVFALVVDFIKSYWQRHKELPDCTKQYFEKNELGLLGNTKIAWEKYIVYLN